MRKGERWPKAFIEKRSILLSNCSCWQQEGCIHITVQFPRPLSHHVLVGHSLLH